jgi:undecaprenyl-diphosphatase
VSIIEAIILGIVEGLTEFIPVSSTGHLTITERLLGFDIDAADITAFTAIIQVGAVAAAVIFFWDDLWGIIKSLLAGLADSRERSTRDFRFGLAVAVGSIPIAIVGLAFRHQIEGSLRSLWVVGTALIVWSGVLWLADRAATQQRGEDDFAMPDALAMGITQCVALIPGVSRSGATIAAGLFRGLDRVTVTRMSFFLAIPALTAAGLLEAATKASDISNGVGWGPTLVALLVSFAVGYVAIAWLLRYVARHDFSLFIVYRVILGVLVLGAVATGITSAT